MWIALCVQTLSVAALLLRPAHAWLFVGLIVCCMTVAACSSRRRLLAFVMAALLAATITQLCVQRRDARLLHGVLDGITADVELRVIETPKRDDNGLRFTARPTDPTLPALLSVRWPDGAAPSSPAEGECWQLRLRLAALSGTRNPGVFDYAGWQRERGIGARATVRPSRINTPCQSRRYGRLDAVRSTIRNSILAAPLSPAAKGVLIALVIGERQGIDAGTRELFAATGTSHLMAISGLHIGLVAGLGFFAGRRLRRPADWLPADRGIVAGALCAAAYVAISGFALPAQRALLMLLLVACIHRARRRIDGTRLVALAALALFVAEPLRIVSAPFVFSFAAVSMIALYSALGRVVRASAPRPAVRAGMRLQCLLGLSLAPLTMGWFGYLSVVSIPANLLVIPVFSLLVVPLAMLASILSLCVPALSTLSWQLVAFVLDGALLAMQWLASRGGAALIVGEMGPGRVLLATLCVAAALLLRALPGRAMAALLLVALVLSRAPAPRPGCVDVTMLDVGHGTAMPMRTARGWLVYDTGPAWRGGGDAGARIVLPFLRSRGATGLDITVVSHADGDHSGGNASLAAGIPVERWLGAGPAGSRPCQAGQRWIHGGVVMHVLWPLAGFATLPDRGNNASCVVRVGSGAGALLISGDIELAAERELVALGGIAAGLVIVPHHGSATSSTPAFIDAVAAREGWISSAAGGRWSLPHADVRRRWWRAGAALQITAERGALQRTLCSPP